MGTVVGAALWQDFENVERTTRWEGGILSDEKCMKKCDAESG